MHTREMCRCKSNGACNQTAANLHPGYILNPKKEDSLVCCCVGSCCLLRQQGRKCRAGPLLICVLRSIYTSGRQRAGGAGRCSGAHAAPAAAAIGVAAAAGAVEPRGQQAGVSKQRAYLVEGEK